MSDLAAGGAAGPPTTLLAELAARQGGHAQTRQMLALGMSRAAISRWIDVGRLHPVHRGVFRLGHRYGGRGGRFMAAALLGAGVAISHLSALQLWKVCADGGGPTHLTAPTQRRSRAGLVVHESRIPGADLCAIDGMPVTTPARSLLDLAEVASPDELERALHEARALRLLRPGELAELRGRTPGRHGWGLLNALFGAERGESFSRSQAERLLRDLVRAAGLPEPLQNARTCGYEVDLFWPERGVAVEFDSWTHHSSRAAFERDREKSADLESTQIRVLRFTWRQLTGRPEWVVARLASVLTSRRPAGPGPR